MAFDQLPSSRSFGIVQGRLSCSPNNLLQWFPQPCWKDEFAIASKVGFSFIEILVEREHNPSNPFWSHDGRKLIKSLCQQNDLELYSSCLDYIINHSLATVTPDLDSYVSDFISATSELGCKVIILPLLEKSDLNQSTFEQLGPILLKYSQLAKSFGLSICIESLMESHQLTSFITSLNDSNIKCVFDTGNRVLLSESLSTEILNLGSLIGHVHIKDKQVSGQNVLLGRGNVDFLSVFHALHEISYNGPLVFETTRGLDPVRTAEYHIHACRFFDSEASRA